LWGVGAKTEAALHALDIRTIGDLGARDPGWLEDRLAGGRAFWELSQGIDPRPVVPDRGAKSIGSEDTFDEDLSGKETLRPFIHAQALRVARRLRHAGTTARVVQLKLKLADFTLLTRRTTLAEPTDDGQTLYRAAMELLARYDLRKRVRLTGVSAQELEAPGPQLALLADTPTRSARLNAALDRIAAKFGNAAVLPADVAAAGEDEHEPHVLRGDGKRREKT
jgi:DNA polymerase-4